MKCVDCDQQFFGIRMDSLCPECYNSTTCDACRLHPRSRCAHHPAVERDWACKTCVRTSYKKIKGACGLPSNGSSRWHCVFSRFLCGDCLNNRCTQIADLSSMVRCEHCQSVICGVCAKRCSHCSMSFCTTIKQCYVNHQSTCAFCEMEKCKLYFVPCPEGVCAPACVRCASQQQHKCQACRARLCPSAECKRLHMLRHHPNVATRMAKHGYGKRHDKPKSDNDHVSKHTRQQTKFTKRR